MAINLTDKTKAIIVLVINAVVAVILGLAAQLGWELNWWQPVVAVLAILLDTWLGIQWVPPKKPSNSTGGSS